ncbi:MAG: DEAD/DEAH box helicase [Aeriscardovia sp.]|nr:DEAD/DEAH box helicase [Aeriscardovia sp.]
MDFQEAMDRRTREYEENQNLPEKDAKGNALEDLTKIYIHTTWRSLGAEVWKWREAGNPLNPEMKGDTGCDLVVKTRDGSLYMVQCKNHSESTLTKDGAHLSNIFQLAAENDIPKERVIFAYLAKGISHYAEDTLETAGICIDEDDFDSIDWAPFFEKGKKKAGKELRPYQKEAVEACVEGFKAEKEEGKPQIGKLVMACGTGKTFTSLSLVKELSKDGPYNVLFLAPFIALVSQTFREWTCEEDIASVVVCSDSTASKKKRNSGEEEEIDERLQDVPFPVSTDSGTISQSWKTALESDYRLHVVFSTYQSIEAVKEFQERSGVRFDLTICDEAHRTASEEGSLFSQAVDPDYIETQKKLFMTATPKIYCDKKAARKQKGAKGEEDKEERPEFYSMDDEEKYGPEFYRFGFGEAVDQGWLCDYRVLILAMREGGVNPKIRDVISGTEAAKEERQALVKKRDGKKKEESRRAAQKKLEEFENELSTLAGKIQGAYIDLSDLEASNQGEVGKAFDNVVSFREVGAGSDPSNLKEPRFAHSAIGFASKINTSKIIKQTFSDPAFPAIGPKIECRHIDGETRSDRRLEDLSWLKQGEKDDEIRLITNAQCLSEGVDVPALDAVIFFEKKVSQIGIIQAVGRVMRKAPGKEFGYIILPVILQDAQDPEGALEKNDEFARIWEILQSMRSVDERLDAKINTLYLSKKGRLKRAKKKQAEGLASPQQAELPFEFDKQLQKSLVSFILSKCGSSMYWEDWVENISGSVQNMINEIGELADTPAIKPKFEEFKENLSKTLHKEQSKEDAVNLIAQFIVTRPVFSILFPASDFDSNPISRALEGIADDFKDAYKAYDKELGELKFSMEQAAKAVAKDPGARKRLVKNFYEKFYQKVFPKEADANGIVYTPEPVVDFMIKETDRLLQRNFGKRLQDEGVQILDPFSGTGTFVTRLLDKSLGVIDDEHIGEKYEKEIWANEIMPTAYYISTLNIEDAMKQRTGEAKSFPGAVLTDTFCISEAKGMLDASLFSQNSDRENEEEDKKIWAIISNPPYSQNQGNSNENNAHARYDVLDKGIASAYKSLQDSTNTQALNDSYIRAFKWASDRLKGKGIVAFITNAGWLRSVTGAGVRCRFATAFNDIYVYDLKGNINLNDPAEGGNIFGNQSKTAIAISFLVKNPDSNHEGQIHYISVPDFVSTDDKLDLMEDIRDKEPEWESLTMDGFGDWLGKRDNSFYSLLPMGIIENRDKVDGIFNIWSAGIQTNRDYWVYSFSKENLLDNVSIFEDFFNEELERWERSSKTGKIEDFVRQDPTKIKWGPEGSKVYTLLRESSYLKINPSCTRISLYRPFTKKYLYFYEPLIHRPGQQPDLFPEANSSNLEICVPGIGPNVFSCLMVNEVPDLNGKPGGMQCFPLYRYQKSGFGTERYERKSAITDQALKMFREVTGIP